MKAKVLFGFAFLLVLVIACHNSKNTVLNNEPTDDSIKKAFEVANKILTKSENEEIEAFLSRYKWPVNTTGTGLKYYIYFHGKGKQAEYGKTVRFHYSVMLINGTHCYDSKTNGPKEFVIGKTEEISGLHEAMQLLRVGDKAKLIIPSHLAYGVIGDGDRIPMKATLIYDVELIEVR